MNATATNMLHSKIHTQPGAIAASSVIGVALLSIFWLVTLASAQDVVTGAYDIGELNDEFGWAQASGDFNGDGFDDLAVGVPGEDLNGVSNAGAVEIIYGSGAGLAAPGRAFFSASLLGISGTNDNAGANLGFALATGDFNNDGFDDLAIGAPQQLGHGAVYVLLGDVDGLGSGGKRALDEGRGEDFGAALATGDFDGDGFDDLAIGSPKSDRGVTNTGMVDIRYGSAEAQLTFGQEFNRGKFGVSGGNEASQLFGAAVTTGDFNGDGFDDLAAGAPGDDVGSTDAGSLNVFYGSSDGLTVGGNQLWHADVQNIVNETGRREEFGGILAAADWNADGFADLAIGVARDDNGTGDINFNSGGVHIIYGSSGGLTAKSGTQLNQFLVQGTDGISDKAEEGDQFGKALSAGDVNGDSISDLLVGSSEAGGFDGGVFVVFGAKGGLGAGGDQRVVSTKDFQKGIADLLGASIATGDFNGDKLNDVAVGDPAGNCSGPGCDNGETLVFTATKSGLTTTDILLWRQPFVIAHDDVVDVEEDNSVLIPVLDNDALAYDLTALSFQQPPDGTGFVQRSGNLLRYQANFPNFVDTVRFAYTVRVNNDRSTAEVTVRIRPRQDAPDFRTGSELAPATVGFPYEATIEARDVDGDDFDFIVEDIPDWLTFADNGGTPESRTATLRGTPLAEHAGDNFIRIRAKDAGTSGTATTFQISVQLGAPAVPELIAPADADPSVALPARLTWQPVPGADTYNVQVATNATFATTVVDTSGVTSDSLDVTSLEANTTYFWRVRATNGVGTSDFSASRLFTTGEATNVSTEDQPTAERTFALRPNYPNPFRGTTTLAYVIPDASDVRLSVFDTFGRLVARVVDDARPAGEHIVPWSAHTLASGTYLVRLEAGQNTATRSVLVIR